MCQLIPPGRLIVGDLCMAPWDPGSIRESFVRFSLKRTVCDSEKLAGGHLGIHLSYHYVWDKLVAYITAEDTETEVEHNLAAASFTVYVQSEFDFISSTGAREVYRAGGDRDARVSPLGTPACSVTSDRGDGRYGDAESGRRPGL